MPSPLPTGTIVHLAILSSTAAQTMGKGLGAATWDIQERRAHQALRGHALYELVLAAVEEHAAGRPDVGGERLARLGVLRRNAMRSSVSPPQVQLAA